MERIEEESSSRHRLAWLLYLVVGALNDRTWYADRIWDLCDNESVAFSKASIVASALS